MFHRIDSPDRDSLPQSSSLVGALHSEIFASAREGAGAAFALALAQDRLAVTEPDPLADRPDQRMWLWVQDKEALRRTGRPYRPGLPRALRHRLIHVAADSAQDALFALEEGLRCRELAFVIGEIAGNPKALSFTAQRRLSLAAQRHGVPLWLVRLDAERDLSSARMRWQTSAAPSPRPRWNAQAPGAVRWRAELFRARRHPPGEWVLCLNDPLPSGGERIRRPGSPELVEGRLAAVGEGCSVLPAPDTPLQAALAPKGASCAILSPCGERAST